MIPLAEVDPLKNVHFFYQDWVKSVQNNQYSEFMDLWETCMIRSTSEAIRETAGSMCGSMMNQHGGKNPHLSPKYFSMELYLKFNLGPLQLLDSLIEEVQKREPVSFVRKKLNAELCSSKDITISAAVNKKRQNYNFQQTFG